MSEDVIRDVTADFIQSNKTNLELALNVEKAMPHVRQHLVGVALDAVEKKFSRTEWRIERSATQELMDKNANLVLSRYAWTTNQSAAAIWLWSPQKNWMSVQIGLYFTGQFSQEVQLIEQRVVLPLKSSGFKFEDTEDEPGVYKFLDAELRDWSSERFLIRLLEDGGLGRIASEISFELNKIDEFVKSSELISALMKRGN